MSNNIHVIPHSGGGWQVKTEGNERATARASTQQEAINIARPMSQNRGVELVIHRPNGQIREKNSHGRDPFPPKG